MSGSGCHALEVCGVLGLDLEFLLEAVVHMPPFKLTGWVSVSSEGKGPWGLYGRKSEEVTEGRSRPDLVRDPKDRCQAAGRPELSCRPLTVAPPGQGLECGRFSDNGNALLAVVTRCVLMSDLLAAKAKNKTPTSADCVVCAG